MQHIMVRQIILEMQQVRRSDELWKNDSLASK